MKTAAEIVGLRELIEAHVGTIAPSLHRKWRAHNARLVAAYESALDVRIPRRLDDVPSHLRTVFMLFSSTVDVVSKLEAPLSGALELSLLVVQLERAGASGQLVLDSWASIREAAYSLRSLELNMLVQMIELLHDGRKPSATLDKVRATGLYPGSTPHDWDEFDDL